MSTVSDNTYQCSRRYWQYNYHSSLVSILRLFFLIPNWLDLIQSGLLYFYTEHLLAPSHLNTISFCSMNGASRFNLLHYTTTSFLEGSNAFTFTVPWRIHLLALLDQSDLHIFHLTHCQHFRQSLNQIITFYRLFILCTFTITQAEMVCRSNFSGTQLFPKAVCYLCNGQPHLANLCKFRVQAPLFGWASVKQPGLFIRPWIGSDPGLLSLLSHLRLDGWDLQQRCTSSSYTLPEWREYPGLTYVNVGSEVDAEKWRNRSADHLVNGGELWGEVCVHNRQHSLKYSQDSILDLREHVFRAFEPTAATLRLSLRSNLYFSASLSPPSESLFLFLSHKRVIHPLRLLIKTIREQQKEQDKRRGEERSSSSRLPKPANLPERCANNFLHVGLIGVELVVNFWEGHHSHRRATSW